MKALLESIAVEAVSGVGAKRTVASMVPVPSMQGENPYMGAAGRGRIDI
jgi:hypothetical protein